MINLVSIIVPCYNQGQYLRESLQSVLDQTYQNWECIIVDDGSTDNSSEIANEFCYKDTRIKYIWQRNEGLSSARNKGLNNASGNFIQLLDSDDLLENRKIEFQVEYLLKNQETDIVYGSMSRFDSETLEIVDKGEWMAKISGRGQEILKDLLFKNIMVVSSPLLRIEVFKKIGYFNTNLRSVEDWEFWIRCAFENVNFEYVDNANSRTLIRSHNLSLMKNHTQMFNSQIIMRKSLNKLIINIDIKKKNTQLLNNLYGENGLFLILNRKYIKGFASIFMIKNKVFWSYLYRSLCLLRFLLKSQTYNGTNYLFISFI
jgi:glycosyltransferase involved in cell wall biosynthesis